ncbi:ribose-5-phosphate isomerase RpiA [Metabacillus malikii]|uniref:Ribose-5-phosphate isomerase A n=1 Tax=Metabacillus malikii TaxID=1504265 RepID=A0ABT9ZHM8_9BACI|nr:ribose-5-phosphate isomerase RpiA [Metabacillus malikii]MDQ0231788.1 ribose 5-phosphate isomerase A [Metabacillus malikii]
MKGKQLAGEKAVEYIEDGMIVGLGTGSTAYYAIKKIGELVKSGFKIKCVSTSTSTTELATTLGIELVSLNDVESIDITIDGADEIDKNNNAIKGGGGALLFEKLVATASKKVIWVVDSSKMVTKLGDFLLPIEVIPFGAKHVYNTLEINGYQPKFRYTNEMLYKTDSNNYIIDVNISNVSNYLQLQEWLDSITGIVEHGLFLGSADMIVVGSEDSCDTLFV